MKNTISQLTELLAENEISAALNKMQSVFSLAGSDLDADVILLQSQYHRLKSKIRTGIIDDEEANLTHNKILHGLLELMDEIRDNPDEFAIFNKIDGEFEKAANERNLQFPIKVKDSVYKRLSAIMQKNLHLKALWVDDYQFGNNYEVKILSQLNIQTDLTSTSTQAFELIQQNNYDLVISDISRENSLTEGLEFHRKLILNNIDLPFIFYIGSVDRTKGVPPFAFGICDTPSELFHLVSDVIARL